MRFLTKSFAYLQENTLRCTLRGFAGIEMQIDSWLELKKITVGTASIDGPFITLWVITEEKKKLLEQEPALKRNIREPISRREGSSVTGITLRLLME